MPTNRQKGAQIKCDNVSICARFALKPTGEKNEHNSEANGSRGTTCQKKKATLDKLAKAVSAPGTGWVERTPKYAHAPQQVAGLGSPLEDTSGSEWMQCQLQGHHQNNSLSQLLWLLVTGPTCPPIRSAESRPLNCAGTRAETPMLKPKT